MFAVSSTRVVVNAANTSGTKRVAGKKAAAGKPGQKKGFFDWLLEKSVRDSGVIGAGYEDDLKSGQYKPKGGLNISEGGSFKI
ncbi:predicted protein [Ostreococcus lucimarinus CCE9901]|uniref:Uncharacterized protein n=1 Tax=Ostreococcus lucimarinus (strain CCE9901) TaxID=436017 RepID=A4RWQ9_OSTLU|nr:predicted protein [Ostreococcus lucimarinus CCE9901]ABO95916.1 predicted protein [Ostreococcus lucimarinus CCE9901]|eukprot:XP_001417623.1 predicted protein [Ostreococcus lucimarinus CCE9901]